MVKSHWRWNRCLTMKSNRPLFSWWRDLNQCSIPLWCHASWSSATLFKLCSISSRRIKTTSRGCTKFKMNYACTPSSKTRSTNHFKLIWAGNQMRMSTKTNQRHPNRSNNNSTSLGHHQSTSLVDHLIATRLRLPPSQSLSTRLSTTYPTRGPSTRPMIMTPEMFGSLAKESMCKRKR
jgi:hypothetical protein